MSGGHFNHEQYRLHDIASEIERLIECNDSTEKDDFGCEKGRHYPSEIIARFKIAVERLNQAERMVQRIDYLVSDDDGEESFLRRWAEEGLPDIEAEEDAVNPLPSEHQRYMDGSMKMEDIVVGRSYGSVHVPFMRYEVTKKLKTTVHVKLVTGKKVMRNGKWEDEEFHYKGVRPSDLKP